jgi:hypothetical protein
MASIPTASVDALVHVNAYGDPKRRGCSLSAQVAWIKLDRLVEREIVRSVADCRDHETFRWSGRWWWLMMSLGSDQRNFKMSVESMMSIAGRRTVVAAFASLALVAASVSPSAAASSGAPAKAPVASHAVSDATDFSAARRRHYRRGPNAAALAIMGAATGLAVGAIAESRRREYYENQYYYDRGPAYGGNAYYGGGYRQPYAGAWTPAYRQDPRVWGDPRY